MTVKDKNRRTEKRAFRVRNSLGSGRPRLSVVKSNKHLEAQIIDQNEGKTLIGLSTKSKVMKEANLGKKSREAAAMLGVKLAQQALERGISEVVFDRGPFKFHGLLAILAQSARDSGLQF